MTITSKKKNSNQLENCQKYAHKLFWNAFTWHELEDLIFFVQWTNLHDQSQNGPKHVTNAWIDWYLTIITHVNTNSVVMWVILQNNAGWDCFKTPVLLGDLEDSISTSGGTLCVCGSHAFSISWMCKKQTSVSIQGDFIYRRHNELRVHLYVPKEETFPLPPKYNDVTRSTYTNLDVLQE